MMRKEQSCCDPGRIEQLLEGRLAADEQSQFENHLEVCPTCRDRLETTAAERGVLEGGGGPPARRRPRRGDEDRRLDGAGRSRRAGSRRASRRPAHCRLLRSRRTIRECSAGSAATRSWALSATAAWAWCLKGFEPALDRYVAIKLLAPHLATSGAARARFAREARAAAAVLHENVVAIHRVSEAKELPYLVMPYVAGDSLQKRLDEQGPMQLNEILRIGMQIAAGLAAAHAQGLVHRDIKPGNILLDKGVERVTITDFGLARAADDASLTRSGVIAGTPQYMSPEQARGEPLDGRSDLFSLGSVLYAMCVGRPPFRAQTHVRRSAPHLGVAADGDPAARARDARVALRDHHEASRQAARRAVPIGRRGGRVVRPLAGARPAADGHSGPAAHGKAATSDDGTTSNPSGRGDWDRRRLSGRGLRTTPLSLWERGRG